jgi:hypothetical protein
MNPPSVLISGAGIACPTLAFLAQSGRVSTHFSRTRAALRFERIKDDTEVIFGDEVVGMQQMPVYVQIEFKHGKSTPIRSGHWRG